MDKTLGQIAFEAVGACAEIPMKWDRLNEESRIGWESVAAAVAAAVKEEDARICAGVASVAIAAQQGPHEDLCNVMLRHHAVRQPPARNRFAPASSHRREQCYRTS